jgi:hypothetical protein
MLLIVFIFIAVIQILFGFAARSSNTDNFGHLGGFIAGYFITLPVVLILATEERRNVQPGWPYERILKWAGAGISIIFYLLGYILFYTTRNPQSDCPK